MSGVNFLLWFILWIIKIVILQFAFYAVKGIIEGIYLGVKAHLDNHKQ